MFKGLLLISSAAFLALGISPANADTITWTGNGSGDSWCTPQNWDGDTVPGPGDTVHINPPPGQGPVINCDVTVGDIHGPKWSSSSDQVMNVTPGTIIVNGQWLQSGQNTADVYEDSIVNLKDFAVLANSWLAEQLWP